MFNPYGLLGGMFFVTGLTKLAGPKRYRKLIADLNWDSEQMLHLGLAEVLGGVLLMPRSTRRLGGVLLIATSAVVLMRELQRDIMPLALPRAGLLLGSLSAALRP